MVLFVSLALFTHMKMYGTLMSSFRLQSVLMQMFIVCKLLYTNDQQLILVTCQEKAGKEKTTNLHTVWPCDSVSVSKKEKLLWTYFQKCLVEKHILSN